MMLSETVKWCGYRIHTETFLIGEFDEKRDELEKVPSKVPSFPKVSPFSPPCNAPRRTPQRQQTAIKTRVNQAPPASRCCLKGNLAAPASHTEMAATLIPVPFSNSITAHHAPTLPPPGRLATMPPAKP